MNAKKNAWEFPAFVSTQGQERALLALMMMTMLLMIMKTAKAALFAAASARVKPAMFAATYAAVGESD